MTSPVRAAVRIKNSRAGRHAPLLAKLDHERRNIRIGQRSMMLDLRNLATRGQQIVEVTSLAGGVQPRTELANRRPIQDRLNATANLRLGVPDRLQHLHYKRRIDGGHR